MKHRIPLPSPSERLTISRLSRLVSHMDERDKRPACWVRAEAGKTIVCAKPRQWARKLGRGCAGEAAQAVATGVASRLWRLEAATYKAKSAHRFALRAGRVYVGTEVLTP